MNGVEPERMNADGGPIPAFGPHLLVRMRVGLDWIGLDARHLASVAIDYRLPLAVIAHGQ